MAEKISDNIKTIVREVNNLKSQARDASNETRKLNETLRLDPTNAELMQQRIAALKKELVQYHHQMTTAIRYEEQLRKESLEGTAKLATLKQGTKEYKKLEKQLASADDAMQKFHSASEKAETQVKRLQAALRGIKAKDAANEMAESAKKTEQLQKNLENVEKTLKKFRLAIVLVVTALAKMTQEAISQGTELYSLSKRYNTSAENIQKWNRALQLATGESDLFTTSLKVMSKGLSTIPVGRGVAYSNALKGIGVSFKEIRDLDPTAQFEAIIEGLKDVENSSLQSSYAIQLFGESGQSIAEALANDVDAFDEYLEKASQFGIITSENAEKLADMGFKLEAVKSQLSVAAAELTIALAPALQTLAQILNDYILPILNTVIKAFEGMGTGGQAFLLIMISLILIVPKIVAGIHAITIATSTLSAVTAGFQVGLLALAAIIIIIITIIGAVNSKAKSAEQSLNDLASSVSSTYGSMNADFGANVEQVYSTSNERNVNISVDIYGEGDTELSDAQISMVAQLTAEQVNRELGILAKGE